MAPYLCLGIIVGIKVPRCITAAGTAKINGPEVKRIKFTDEIFS
jgi:hypothetical protein